MLQIVNPVGNTGLLCPLQNLVHCYCLMPDTLLTVETGGFSKDGENSFRNGEVLKLKENAF